jgi:hypothetical protein
MDDVDASTTDTTDDTDDMMDDMMDDDVIMFPPMDGGRDGLGENTGQSCEMPSDCYPGVDHDDLSGAVECLDRVEDGYCTHECETDEDCCDAEGECTSDLRQVCSPFESTGVKYCFLSCETRDLESDAGRASLIDAGTSPDDYCSVNAHEDFTCRSTGGGSQNRKVCLPGGAPGDGGGPPNPDEDAGGPAEDGGSASDGGSDAGNMSDASADAG